MTFNGRFSGWFDSRLLDFRGCILDLIERRETGIPGEVVALVGVDGRANNPAYQKLCEVMEQGSAAG
ncbi:MAG: hypothetical protein ACHQX3_06505, partial [Nitrospirales bacterium]